MDVVSACPLRVGSIVWQPRPGAFVLTVVCKATYTLLPAESPPAHDQDPPNEGDDHWNDDERRSLHAATDLVPFKPRAEVVLVGHAYAPEARPVSSLIARMLVGNVDKSIEVHADRLWTQDGQLREGARFTRMPLRYERAGGGPMTLNPVGMRPDAPPDRYGQVPVPNLQPPGFHLERPEDAVPPVGLGPIAPGWPGRWAKLYGNASGWDYRTGLQRPLPQGIEPGFFNAAPPDQQTWELHGNERIVLEHLHPDYPRLATNLTGPSPHAVVNRAGAAPQELPLRCDTLCIDTDRGVCSLVWRAQVVLAWPDEAGNVVIATSPRRDAAPRKTIVGGARAAAVLPFAGEAAPDQEDDGARTMPAALAGGGQPVLPFREARPWEGTPAIAMPTEGAARRRAGGTGTIFAIRGESGEVLPFAGLSARGAPVAAPPPEPVVAPLPARVEATPWAPAFGREDVARVAGPPPPPPAPAEPPAQPPAQPAMIGPLATAEMYAASRMPLGADGTASPGESSASPPPAAPPKVELPTVGANEPGPSSAGTNPLRPTVASSIEHCAAIAARLAQRPADRKAVLEGEELTPLRWESQHARWLGEIRTEVERGKKKLLAAYDAAYVAALVELRGPILAGEYARLSIAAERGKVAAMLAELDLPEDAMMRIRRVWLARLVKDPRAAAEVRAALRVAAEE